jgi:predicted Fe-Mo cluster-binding NifX family protein
VVSKLSQNKEYIMDKNVKRIAVPVADGKLCMHFGHCQKFALVDIQPADQSIVQVQEKVPPPHEPGVLPRWLTEQGVHLVIAGGMGQRAQMLFAEQGIETLTGAPAETPEHVAVAWAAGTLACGGNVCDH